MSSWPTLLYLLTPLLRADFPLAQAETYSGRFVRFVSWVLTNYSDYWAGHVMLAMIWAGIAQGKGRSGLVWFVLALLFPILSWAVLLVLPVKR